MLKTNLANYYPSSSLIFYNKLIKFIIVGRYLHGMAFIGIILFLLGLQNTIESFQTTFTFIDYIWFYAMFQSIGIFISTELDAYGRYQNYKQIKDTLFTYGFDYRLIIPFTQSKCQRDAVLAASADLGCQKQVKLFFYNKGYRWYHMFPDSFLKNPLIIFNNRYMLGILFTKKHELQNFYW